MGKSSGGVRGVTTADISAVSVSDIRNSFSAISAAASSRYGGSQLEQIADREMQRISTFLDKDSLAYQIVRSADPSRGLTTKQEWVVAYQLMKNQTYVKQVAATKKRKAAEKGRIKESRRKARQEKESARKQRAEKTQRMIEQGYRLVQIGRQYKWVK